MFDTKLFLPCLLIIVFLISCDIPKDPEGTFDRVKNGTIRAGIVESNPWTFLNNGTPSGIEVEILKGIADQINADIRWKEGTAHDLFAALEHGELDIVLSGLTKSSPFTKLIGPSKPFAETKLIVALPLEMDFSVLNTDSLEVAVPFGSFRKALIEKSGYKTVETENMKQYDGPVCIYDYELDEYTKKFGKKLKQEYHILPVRRGENEWLVYIENYCRKNKEKIKKSLESYGGEK